jgi:hypothetical protein
MDKIFYIFMLLSNVVHASNNAIEIKTLESKQKITQLLDLQKNMKMSANPKELSHFPQVICFNVDLDQYLPIEHKNKQPIYGCIFSDQVAMNAALLRAGLYVHTASASIATDEQLFSSNLMTAVGGHDFSGKDLLEYKDKASIFETTQPEYEKLKNIEKEFDEKVLSPIIHKNHDHFIFFAIINTNKFKENLSHELLHSQYYNFPQIKIVLLKVWEQVDAKHKQIIIKCLQDGGYDANQQELLLREFYSYFLQYNAEDYLKGIKVLEPMSALANIYAKKIQLELNKNQIQVLTVA